MAVICATRAMACLAILSIARAAQADGIHDEFYVHAPDLPKSAADGSARVEMRRRCDNATLVFECLDVFDTGAYGRVRDNSTDMSRVLIALGGGEIGREGFQDIQGGEIHSRPTMPRAPRAIATVTYLAGRELLSGSAGGDMMRSANVNDIGGATVEQVRGAPYHLAFLNERARIVCNDDSGTAACAVPRDTFRYARKGVGVTVYILGEGVNVDHVDFRGGRARSGLDLFEDASPCARWQGTHVASVVNGIVHGVAKGARVVSVAVTPGCRRQMPVRNLVRGLQWVLDDRRNGRGGAAVLLTVPRVDVRTTDRATVAVVEGLAQALLDSNVSMVSSIGAGRHDACNFSPQRLSGVIAPAALDVFHTAMGSTLARPWLPTNFGACVDIWAPGARIQGAFAPDVDATAVYSGTAQAAAMTTGVAAMILESEPHATPVRVRDLMMRAATTTSGMMYTRPNTTSAVLQAPLFV